MFSVPFSLDPEWDPVDASAAKAVLTMATSCSDGGSARRSGVSLRRRGRGTPGWREGLARGSQAGCERGRRVCRWAKTRSSSSLNTVRWDQRSSSPATRSAIGTERRVDSRPSNGVLVRPAPVDCMFEHAVYAHCLPLRRAPMFAPTLVGRANCDAKPLERFATGSSSSVESGCSAQLRRARGV